MGNKGRTKRGEGLFQDLTEAQAFARGEVPDARVVAYLQAIARRPTAIREAFLGWVNAVIRVCEDLCKVCSSLIQLGFLFA